MLGRGVIANPSLPQILTADNIVPEESQDSFRSFHDELLEGYRDYMSGDQPVLFKMKELWTFRSQYVDIDKKTLKKIRKAQSISAYQSAVEEVLTS
jgi:hypothetical protein